MSGSGNDFIIIDNREGLVDEKSLKDFVAGVCRRKMSVGSDGLILVENSDHADFKWRFFNSDGNTAEMCGNGARCVARFAYLNRITGREMSFETDAGIVSAQVTNHLVKVKMPEPVDLKTDYSIDLKSGSLIINSVNTGVPHVVINTEGIDDIDVFNLGREIRFHEIFSPAGTNVNFIYPRKNGVVDIRTYERGVEDETLACGTGSVAAAIVLAKKSEKTTSPVDIKTQSGIHLYIYYKQKEDGFYDVYLEGDARIIYTGKLYEEAWPA
jgi:diaminopimelate epimerase